MSNVNIGWPEGLILLIIFLNICLAASYNGQPRKGTYNLGLQLFGSAISVSLLYWGGFFS